MSELGVASADTSLWIALLTGGGIALVGTALGALITQFFAVRISRETRRDERKLVVKSFQRDALVSLQDNVVQLFDATGDVLWAVRATDEINERERNRSIADYNISALRVRMLASRVRDDELRAAVQRFLDAHEVLVADPDAGHRSGEGEQRRAGSPMPPPPPRAPSVVDVREQSLQLIYDRAGELIRTLDEIDEATS